MAKKGKSKATKIQEIDIKQENMGKELNKKKRLKQNEFLVKHTFIENGFYRNDYIKVEVPQELARRFNEVKKKAEYYSKRKGQKRKIERKVDVVVKPLGTTEDAVKEVERKVKSMEVKYAPETVLRDREKLMNNLIRAIEVLPVEIKNEVLERLNQYTAIQIVEGIQRANKLGFKALIDAIIESDQDIVRADPHISDWNEFFGILNGIKPMKYEDNAYEMGTWDEMKEMYKWNSRTSTDSPFHINKAIVEKKMGTLKEKVNSMTRKSSKRMGIAEEDITYLYTERNKRTSAYYKKYNTKHRHSKKG